MKIAIVSLDDSNKIKMGGKHIHQLLLQRGLEENGHSVKMIFPKRDFLFLIMKVVFAILCKIRFCRKSQAFSYTLNHHMNSLRKQISPSSNLDLYLAQDPVSMVALKQINSNKKILTLHGYLSRESVNYINFDDEDKILAFNCAMVYEREALKGYKKIITVDSKIKKYLEKEFECTNNVVVLKNAIDISMFAKTNTETIRAIRVRYCSNEDQKIIFVPRRLVKKNGVHVIIECLNKYRKELANKIIVLIGGEGPLENELRSLITSNGLEKCIYMLGGIAHDEIIKYYDSCDVVLVPSVISDGVEEATSLSMLESMAAKKITIVSDIGGMSEVIEHEKNGFKFEQGNVDELGNLLRDLFYIPAENSKSLAENGYQYVLSNHHYKKHSLEYIK